LVELFAETLIVIESRAGSARGGSGHEPLSPPPNPHRVTAWSRLEDSCVFDRARHAVSRGRR
jgi:hypothetical protein